VRQAGTFPNFNKTGSKGGVNMTNEKVSRLIQQIEIQHDALCTDYKHMRDLLAGMGGSEETKLEKIAYMYWQLRSQMSDIANAPHIEIDFR